MLDGFSWDAVKDIGLSGLAIGAVGMILTGRLVPRWFYQQKDIEAKAWKAAAEETREQNKELLQYARTADALLKALPRGKGTNEVD
jgi:hypothetical protein